MLSESRRRKESHHQRLQGFATSVTDRKSVYSTIGVPGPDPSLLWVPFPRISEALNFKSYGLESLSDLALPI